MAMTTDAARRRPGPSRLDGATVLVVDGNSLAHRAYHAYAARNGREELTRGDGTPVWAVYGFCALLAGIINKVHPDHLIVGFDDPGASQRRDRYPAYKGTRADKDAALVAQLADIPVLLAELGVAVMTPDGLEADDVCGSVAAATRAAGGRCTIATSDRDAFSLIDDTTTVLRLVSGLDNAVEVTPEVLVTMCGVQPHQYRDYASVRGDTSDNLPGVAGIGEKTAAKLLGAYATVADALADPDGAGAVIGKAAGAKLAAARTEIARNVDLMTIVCDLPVEFTTSRLDADPMRIAAKLREAELPNLAERMAVALSTHHQHTPVTHDPVTHDPDDGTAPCTTPGHQAIPGPSEVRYGGAGAVGSDGVGSSVLTGRAPIPRPWPRTL